jgi:hypothetical protein
MAIRGGAAPAGSPATAKPGPDKTAKLLAPRAAAAKPPTPLDGDQKRLRAELAAELEKQRAAFRKFDGYAEPLAKKIAAAQGDEKKKLLAAKAEIEKRKGEAEKAMHEAHADLEALDSPNTKHEELVKILARRGSRSTRATEVSYDQAGLDTPTKRNHDVTTTTTGYADGKAVVDKVRDHRHVGVGGSTTTHAHETEVSNDKLSVKTADEKTTKISTTGKYSVDTKKSVEVELADGRKAGATKTDAKEVSLKGAKHEQTTTVTHFDGSSDSKTRTREVERGEGKVVAKTGTSTTTTTASGTDTKRDTSASGGMIAGKDGYGATGAVEKGKTVTTKGGRQAGVVAGLHANVTCNVGDPKGDPPVYPVTVTVSFGGSVGVSAGHGKQEGSKASVDVSVKASEERSMTVTHMLPASELGGYVQALHDASKKGGKVAATHREFAIIAAGVNQGWDAARQMWKGGGVITKQTADGLTHAGDSIEKSEASGRGASVKGKVGPVGGGVGVTETDEHSTKVTRNEKGGLDVEGKGAHGSQKDVSASVNVGVVGLEVGKVHTHKTNFGYEITLDPKNDPDGKILEHLAACTTEQDYQVFMAVHHGKITVKGITHGQADAEGTNVGVAIGGAKLGIGTHQGIDEQTTRDEKGKVLKKKVGGHAGAGGTLGPLADSVDEDAVAEIDEEGNADLTLTSTTTDNHNSRARDKRIDKIRQKLTGEKKEGGGTGALTSAAGGEEDDSAVKDVSGLKLSNKDLKKIGASACRSFAYWMEGWRRADEKDDWKKAGQAIVEAKGAPAVVAEELARFVGGDRVERMKTLERFIRGGWHATTGHAFEFPDSLRDIRDDYDLVTDDKLPNTMNALANKKGDAAAAAECKRLVAVADRVSARIHACGDFDNVGTKAEMMQQVTIARNMLFEGIKGFGGDVDAKNDVKVLEEQAGRLIKLCTEYSGEQMKMMLELRAMPIITVSERIDGRKKLKQLEDLQYRWTSEFLRLKETFEKRKMKFTLDHLAPDTTLVDIFEKRFGS